MTDFEKQPLLYLLAGAQADGLPWVAFDDRPENSLYPYGLHFFASAGEAEAFCDKVNYQIDPFEPGYGFENYGFTPVACLKAALGDGLHVPDGLGVDMSEIARQMAAQELYLMPGKTVDELKAAFDKGLVCPVSWQRIINPQEAIAEFSVIAHQHNGGQIYEIGHSHLLLESFAGFKDARNFMENAVHLTQLSDRGTDYLLAGRFHGQALDLDMEGYALQHSGLTLVTAHHNYENSFDWQELHSLSEPVTIKQYFFAGMDKEGLRLYNDKLEPTTTQAAQLPFYPTHFTNEYLTLKNTVVMNQKNVEFLSDQLRYNGFGEKLADEMKQKIEQQPEKFQLQHQAEFNGHKVDAILDFNKSKESEMYFFNNYKVTLMPENAKAALTQNFYIQHKGQSVNLKEAYNLMNGRAVFKEKYANKEGQTYPAWLKLNFKELDKYGSFKLHPYNENYGFKLEEAINKHPIMEMVSAADKARLVQSLEKGNRVEVTFNLDGKLEKRFIEASPTSHGLNLFDADQKVIRQEWEPRPQQKEGQGAKAGQAAEQNETNKKKNNKKQGQLQ